MEISEISFYRSQIPINFILKRYSNKHLKWIYDYGHWRSLSIYLLLKTRQNIWSLISHDLMILYISVTYYCAIAFTVMFHNVSTDVLPVKDDFIVSESQSDFILDAVWVLIWIPSYT